MRVRIRREVDVDVPAQRLWEYVVDWPAQSAWVPLTRVERVDPGDPAHTVGGRIRAWTGVGPVGFWDTMTITSWEVRPDGGGRCEVLHTGAVVKGEGVFEVVSTSPDASRFVWSELAVVPFGRAGASGWRVVRPLVERGIDRALRSLKHHVESLPAHAD